MLNSTNPSIDSTVVRKKYISISKKARKNLEKSYLDEESLLNDDSCTLGFNCSSCESLLSTDPTSFKGGFEAISNTLEKLDIFCIANQSTQDSLITSQSIEDYEIKQKIGRFSIEDLIAKPTLNHIEIKSPSKDSIFFDSQNTEEFNGELNHSNDSSPHLYTDYADKLKNILLEYFDE